MLSELEDESSREEVTQVTYGIAGFLLAQGEDYSSLVTYADILHAIGEFGTFQRRLVALTFIPYILSAFFMLGQVYMLRERTHYCDTTWLLTLKPNLSTQELFNLTLPRKANGSFEDCKMYSPVRWDFESIVKYGLNDTEDCQRGWIYEQSYEISPVNEFDLVCDQASKPLISWCVFVFGLMFGSVITGSLSDRIGRYKSILIMLLLFIVFGFGTAFVPSFEAYIIFQFNIGVAITGYALCSTSLVTEWLVFSRRANAIILSHCFFALGLVLFSGLSYVIPHWRLLQLAGGAPAIFLFPYIWFLPESPRWLMMRGETEKAKLVLCMAATINKKTIPPELLEELSRMETPYGSVLNILQDSNMRKMTMILAYVWFSISCGYYALNFHIQEMKMRMYGTLLAFRLVEVPARLFCFTLVKNMGRRKSQSIALMLGGLTGLLSGLVSEDENYIKIILTLISQTGMAASVTICFIYSSESFPTYLRQVGLGLMSLVSCTAVICIPLFIAMYHQQPDVVMISCGTMILVAGFLCFQLPEK